MLELAGPFNVNARGQLHLLGHDALGLVHEADHVAVAAHVQRDVSDQLAVLALDLARPFHNAHIGHFGERDLQWSRSGVVSRRDRVRVVRRPRHGGRGRVGHRGGRRWPLRHAAADEQPFHGVLVLAVVPGVADAHREAVAALDGLRDHPAA